MTDRLAELTGGVSFAEDVLESRDEEEQPRPNNDESVDSEMQGVIDKFQEETDELGEQIGIIEKATLEVKSLFRAALEASDGDDGENREAAESLCDATSERSQNVRKRLRALGEENRAFKRDFPTSSGELRLRVTQHQALAKRFMRAMEDWEATNESYREKAHEKLVQKVQRLRPDASEDEVKKAVRDGDEDFLMQAQERNRATAAIEDLRQRTKDIKRLEESIIALHQLFVDMQIMVETQGELLNEVEYEIGETRGQTQQAHEELIQARAHQKSAQKKKCCIIMLIILIILGAAIGLIVKFAPQWIRAARDKALETIKLPINSTEPAPSAAPAPAPAPPPSNQTAAPGSTTTRLLRMLPRKQEFKHYSYFRKPLDATELVEQLYDSS